MLAGRGSPLACVGALWLLLLGPSEGQARAAPLNAALDYGVTAGCPDADHFRLLVTGRLGYDPFDDSSSQHILIRVTPRDGSLEGRIEWRDPSGNWAGDQTFSAVTANCRRLVRAMAFALAVQIQLLASAQTGPEADAAPPPAAPQATPPSSPAAPVTAAPPPPPHPTPLPSVSAPPPSASGARRPGFLVGAGPSVGFGFSSDPVLLGRLFGAVAWPRISIELGAEVSVPSTTRRRDGAGVSQQQLVLSGAGCMAFGRWSTCLLGEAGQVRMAGRNIERPTSAVVALVATGARLGFTQRLGHHAFVAAHAEGLAILSRWTARLDQIPVWTSPRFAASLGIDAGVRFR